MRATASAKRMQKFLHKKANRRKLCKNRNIRRCKKWIKAKRAAIEARRVKACSQAASCATARVALREAKAAWQRRDFVCNNNDTCKRWLRKQFRSAARQKQVSCPRKR
jgi:hypothetical protein